jgi:hypothetical protein
MLAIPTVFDLLATVLMNVGLLWVTASVYQVSTRRAMQLPRVSGGSGADHHELGCHGKRASQDAC